MVLGSGGQLGREFSRLASDGVSRVIGLSRPDFDARDPTGLDRLLAGHTPDVVVNCVAATNVDGCEGAPEEAERLNATFARAAARAARDAGARFVQVSTDYVFGGEDRDSPIPVDAHPAPVNVYGCTKARGEAFAQDALPDCLVVRVSALFGVTGASGKGGNFIETILRLGRERPELRVVDDQFTAPTHAADAAAAIVTLAAGGSPGIHHAVSSGQATWCDLARAVLEDGGIDTPVTGIATRDFPARAVRPAYSVLDNSGLAAAGAAMPHWREAVTGYMKARQAKKP